MSNNNLYWGQRFGSIYKDGDTAFKIKKWDNGANRSGPHQIAVDPNSPIGKKAKMDSEYTRAHPVTIRHVWKSMELNGQKAA